MITTMLNIVHYLKNTAFHELALYLSSHDWVATTPITISYYFYF